MNELPNDLKYSASHEWVRNEGDGTATVGITDHAQSQLGDLVYIELPEPGATMAAGQECAVVESVKAASDIYCPISGKIIAVNEALVDSPETVNESAFADGWLFRLSIADPGQLDDLMDADAYQQQVDEEAH